MITVNDILYCSQASLNAYHGKQGKVTNIGNNPENKFEAGNTKGIYVEIDGTLIIAFQGSATISDWVNNFQIKKSPLFFEDYSELDIENKSMVHSGWIKQYYNIHNTIFNIIDPYKGRRILFTGHSLGGVLATFAAYHEKSISKAIDKYEDIKLITFGTPRMGDQIFAKNVENMIPDDSRKRYKHKNDFATNFISWVRGYRHIGSETHIGASKFNLSKYIIKSIPDHSMQRYRDIIFEDAQIHNKAHLRGS